MILLKDMHFEYFLFSQKEFATWVSSYVCVCRFCISEITMKITKFTLLKNLVADLRQLLLINIINNFTVFASREVLLRLGNQIFIDVPPCPVY